MKNYSNLAFILLGVLLMLLLLFTFKKQSIGLLGGYTELEKTVEIDTVFLPIEIDTLEVFNDYVTTKGIILNPKPIIKYISPDIKEIKEPIQPDYTKTYNVAVKDTLIDGEATVVNDNYGNLLEFDITYKPLFPKYIEKRIPYEVTKTITNTVSNDRLMFGIGARVNLESYIGGSINVLDKKKAMFSIDVSKKVNTGMIKPNMPDVLIGVNFVKFF